MVSFNLSCILNMKVLHSHFVFIYNSKTCYQGEILKHLFFYTPVESKNEWCTKIHELDVVEICGVFQVKLRI